MSSIEVADLTLALGERTVLADVGFSIADAELVGVLGPNGAGKTTLMRAILGLLPPVRGSIRVLGAPAAHGNPAVGYMPQHRSAAGLHLRGWDFVAGALAGHRWGLPILGRAARQEVERVLALVGATDLARRPLRETSGGERQRLLLAQRDVAIGVVLALAWLGLALAFYTDWPTSFWITALSGAAYFASALPRRAAAA